ncbi:MAG: T9SS type A sorting domain-containing protein [Saprospiraceae bacterium]
MSLPWPGRDSQYAVFHQRVRDRFWPHDLLLTTVDMRPNGGLGRVTSKNVVLCRDSFAHLATAVRHGNGRDWWVVVPTLNSDQFVLYLLDPSGLHGPYLRQSPLRWSGGYYAFWGHQCAFSPQGTRFARMSGENGLHIYDFDRCTGEFSCPRKAAVPGQERGATGVAFSPNGRFVYVSTSQTLLQYDLSENDLGKSGKLIGEFDGFEAPLPTTFYQMMLAPDQKIYMSCTNGAWVLHTIHAPDRKGTACDFRQHDLLLPAQNGFVLPNFPHFRVYDWADSPCDTLGVDVPPGLGEPVSKNDTLLLWPNPAQDHAYIAVPDTCCFPNTLRVYSATGALVKEEAWLTPGETYDLDVRLLAEAVYFLVFANEKITKTVKLVVAR